MPSTMYAGRQEDAQRMREQLRYYAEILGDKRRFATGEGGDVLKKYRELATTLGLPGDAKSAFATAEAIKQQGNNFNPETYFKYQPQMQQTGQPGAAPPSIGSPVGGLREGGPDGNPYSYIINPDAYQYGGKQGTAEIEQERYASLRDAAAAEKAKYAQQYQGGIDQSGQSREQQLQGLNYLKGIAEGTGPSAAMGQMAQGLSQARNQQASIAASARGGGGNLAAAQAAGANAAGQIGLQGIQSASALRSQEQLGAIGQYGQLAGQMREGDFDVARLGAGQQLAAGQQQMTWDQYRQAVMAQQSGYQQAAEQQNLAREGAIRGWDVAQSQIAAANEAKWIAAITGGISAAGGLANAFAPKAKP